MLLGVLGSDAVTDIVPLAVAVVDDVNDSVIEGVDDVLGCALQETNKVSE